MYRLITVIVLVVACNATPKREPAITLAKDSRSASDALPAVDKQTVPDVTKACAAYADALCQSFERCLGAWPVLKYGDGAACRATEATICNATYGRAGSTVSDASMARCIDALATTRCPFFGPDLPACAPPPGLFADGEKCAADVQCAGGLCKRDPAKSRVTGCGTCARLPAEGAACPDYRCEAGLECIARKCTRKAESGGACGETRRCAMGLRCVAGACTPQIDAGGTCKADEDCQAGFACTKRRCTRRTPLAPGKQCADLSFDPLQCIAGHTCVRGTCQRVLSIGDTCGGDTKHLCPYWAPCVGGTCQVLQLDNCE